MIVDSYTHFQLGCQLPSNTETHCGRLSLSTYVAYVEQISRLKDLQRKIIQNFKCNSPNLKPEMLIASMSASNELVNEPIPRIAFFKAKGAQAGQGVEKQKLGIRETTYSSAGEIIIVTRFNYSNILSPSSIHLITTSTLCFRLIQ